MKKKNGELQSQVECLKLELENAKRSTSIDEYKVKETYKLTVELGCLREENNELSKNLSTQRDDFY